MRGGCAREDQIDRLNGHDGVAVERVEVEHQNVGWRADIERAGARRAVSEPPVGDDAPASHAPRSMTASKPQPPCRKCPSRISRMISSSSSKAEESTPSATRQPRLSASGDRRDAALEMQIRARVGRDDRPRSRDRVKLRGPRVNAVGEGQARREQPKRIQTLGDAFRVGAVGKGPLIPCLEQMHVHAPAGPPRRLGDRGEKRIGAPLRAVRPELDRKQRALRLGGDRLDAGDLLDGSRHRSKELGLDDAADIVRQLRQDAVFAA